MARIYAIIGGEHVVHLDMTLGTSGSVYYVVPYNVKLTSIYTIIDQALTVADEVLTVKNNAGSTAGTITITQSGSAAKDIDSVDPTSNNTFVPGELVEIATNGGNGTAARCDITMVFQPV